MGSAIDFMSSVNGSSFCHHKLDVVLSREKMDSNTQKLHARVQQAHEDNLAC